MTKEQFRQQLISRANVFLEDFDENESVGSTDIMKTEEAFRTIFDDFAYWLKQPLGD